MTIPEIHADVARCRDATLRTSDPVQRGQWFHVARVHIPALVAERDRLTGLLETWDAAMAVPYAETTANRAARMGHWLAHLGALEAVYGALDVLDSLMPAPVDSSAPRRAYDDAAVVVTRRITTSTHAPRNGANP